MTHNDDVTANPGEVYDDSKLDGLDRLIWELDQALADAIDQLDRVILLDEEAA